MTYRKEDFFYQTAGKGQLYTQEAPITEDKILMHSYYPHKAAMVQSYVEDACDEISVDEFCEKAQELVEKYSE